MDVPQPSAGVIIGVALVLFSSVLVGVGIHHLIATGSCSSSGYSQYGPVPTCPPGTGIWILFMAGGVIGNVIGALVAGSPTLIFATLFPAIGVGAFTLSFDTHAASFAKTFGLLFGGGFLVPGVIAAGSMLGGAMRGARRARATRSRTSRHAGRVRNGRSATSRRAGRVQTAASATSPASSPSWSATPAAPAGPAASQTSGLLDQISRLSDLHKAGALSDAEFESEKAKLLNRL
jgi:hypothetical protein